VSLHRLGPALQKGPGSQFMKEQKILEIRAYESRAASNRSGVQVKHVPPLRRGGARGELKKIYFRERGRNSVDLAEDRIRSGD